MRYVFLGLALALTCNTFVYRHKDSIENWMDYIVIEYIINENLRRGICIEAIYVMPDAPLSSNNRYLEIRTGQQDPYFTPKPKH